MLNGDSLPWILEEDETQPGVRYFTLLDILGFSADDTEVKKARAAVMKNGPVPTILAHQEAQGYWVRPGPGYGPKYRGTVWSIIFLAQLGADGVDSKVHLGCEYLMAHNTASNGGFSINGTPSAFAHCMAGNMEIALIDLGYLNDERLQRAIQWQARTVTGEGIANIGDKEAK